MGSDKNLERNRAYRQILHLIIGGGSGTTAPLSERQLSTFFQIGRTAVCEALRAHMSIFEEMQRPRPAAIAQEASG